MSAFRFRWFALALAVCCVLVLAGQNHIQAQSAGQMTVRQIIVPDEDRFTPFAITIRVGQTVKWTNNDTDDHTIVSDDAFNTAGHRGVNVLLPAGASYSLTFNHAGVFPFYCRFHAMLDADNQPKAPGPDGGIQDQNGNFGTPMNGVITVVND